LLILLQLFSTDQPYRESPYIPRYKSHAHFHLTTSFQRIRPNPRPRVTFRNALFFLRRGVNRRKSNPKDGGSPPVGCQQLLVKYNRSYRSYLEAVSTNRRPRKRHTVVTRNTLNMEASYGCWLLRLHLRTCGREMQAKEAPYRGDKKPT
jgi:hypothetical protein